MLLFFFYISSSSFRKIYVNIFSFLLFVYQMLHLLPFLRSHPEFIAINAALIGINVALITINAEEMSWCKLMENDKKSRFWAVFAPFLTVKLINAEEIRVYCDKCCINWINTEDCGINGN